MASRKCLNISVSLFLLSFAGNALSMSGRQSPRGHAVSESRAGIAGDTTVVILPPDSDNVDLGGMVIDRTISSLGRNFAHLFEQSWNPPSTLGDYTVIIEEKPMPTLGTLVFVKVNGNYVFKRFVKPRYDAIREVAEVAAGVALNYAENYKSIEKQLDGEDMSGSGIH